MWNRVYHARYTVSRIMIRVQRTWHVSWHRLSRLTRVPIVHVVEQWHTVSMVARCHGTLWRA